MSVPNQGHFYCSSAPFDNKIWLIYERRCKVKDIEVGCLYRAPSRHYAYKIAKILNRLYRLNRLSALKRWRLVCVNRWSPCTPEHANMDYRFACDLLSSDDSAVMSAPIIGSFGV